MLSYIKKNFYIKITLLISFAGVLGTVLSYFIVVLISRELGAEGLGQYSFIFAFAGVFFLFSDWGLSSMLIKDLSKNFSKINKYVSNIFSLKLILSLISLFIFLITIFFIGKENIILPLIIVGFLQLIRVFNNIFYSILRIKQSGKILAIVDLLERIIAFIGALIFLPIYKSLFSFVLVLFVSYSLHTLLLFFYSKNFFNLKFSLDFNFLLNLIKKGFPFLFIAVFSIIYIELDSIMLSFMKGDVVVGWYNSGYKLISILNMVPVLLLTFGFPIFSKFYQKNKKEFRNLFENILNISIIIMVPTIFGVLILGDRILEFIYNFNSIESFISFKILIFAQFFIFLTNIMGQLISSADKQIVFGKIAGVGAIINIILNFFLIPKYSLYGAAFATLITYIIMFIFMYFYIRKKLIKFNLFRYLILPFLLSVGMYFLIKTYLLNLHLILIILIGGLFYFLFFTIFMIIKLKFLKFFK
jgi:O-antigen/teichoic acid export membrane protein